MMSISLLLVALFPVTSASVSVSALISGSEVAYFSLGPNDLDTLRQSDDAPSRRVLHLKRSPRILLSTILIANNFINIGIVLLSDRIIWSIFGEEGFYQAGLWLEEYISLFSLLASDYSRILNFLITVLGVNFLISLVW